MNLKTYFFIILFSFTSIAIINENIIAIVSPTIVSKSVKNALYIIELKFSKKLFITSQEEGIIKELIFNK